MSQFSAFLSQNRAKPENKKVVASKHFVEDGKPILWELRCLSAKESEAIKKSCTYRAPVPGKKGLYLPETDFDAQACKLAAASTVFPDLNSKELQDSYGVLSAEDLLQAMLTPGEYLDYVRKAQEVNGFDVDMSDLVDEAKNS